MGFSAKTAALLDKGVHAVQVYAAEGYLPITLSRGLRSSALTCAFFN